MTKKHFDSLVGRRCILLARCSGNSVPDGDKKMLGYCRENALTIADKVSLANVPAGDQGMAEAIETLLRRKDVKNDFDLILTESIDRLTRLGVETGMHLLRRMENAGIEVVTLQDGQVDQRWLLENVCRCFEIKIEAVASYATETRTARPSDCTEDERRRGSSVSGNLQHVPEGLGAAGTDEQEGGR